MSKHDKPAIYGRATSADGERSLIPAARRDEYEADVARLIEAARPCVQHFGPHEQHGLDCATPAEWDKASAAFRKDVGGTR